MVRMIRASVFILLIFAGISSLFLQKSLAAPSSDTASLVTVLTIQGAIGPAVEDYVTRGIQTSEKRQAKAIVLNLDTPGGLMTSMRGIIKAILASNIPIIGYVSPSGAHAASAGTYILYATHIAAMAPGTNLGAATPVNIVSPTKPDTESDKKLDQKKKQPATEDSQSAMQAKALNDAKAYIRSLAQLRNRNEAWAVQAVEKAESLSAQEALKLNVINFVSPSITALLKTINGETIEVNNTKETLTLTNPTLHYLNPDWRNKILHVITNPSVAYVLLMLGVYGLFFEFMNPGYVAPGVIGGIALLLALYAFDMLPINYVGLGLIVLGIIFMVAETFLPSFGALGFGGIIAFLVGSFLLLDTNMPGFTLPWQLIIGITVATALFMIGVAQLIIRSRWRKVVSGVEGMIGASGVVEKAGDQYWVIVGSERWHVKSSSPLHDKQTVTVVRVEGLTLIVK